MAVPAFLDAPFRFQESQISDVQIIIDNLYDELVTNPASANKWTCTLGGKTQSPTAFKSPTRSDGVFFTINCTRISQTRIAYVVRDAAGLLVNNDTDTRQDIRAGSSIWVRLYTGPFYVVVDSGGATAGTPECWAAGVLDRTPEPLGMPRACYYASAGPRRNSDGALQNNTGRPWFTLKVGATSYAIDSYAIIDTRSPYTNQYIDRYTVAGTLCFLPMEVIDTEYLLGRMFNWLMTDWGLVNQAEYTVPLDGNTTGVFKILGLAAGYSSKFAVRKS